MSGTLFGGTANPVRAPLILRRYSDHSPETSSNQAMPMSGRRTISIAGNFAYLLGAATVPLRMRACREGEKRPFHEFVGETGCSRSVPAFPEISVVRLITNRLKTWLNPIMETNPQRPISVASASTEARSGTRASTRYGAHWAYLNECADRASRHTARKQTTVVMALYVIAMDSIR